MGRRGKIRVISYAVALVISLSAAIAACHVGARGYTIRLDAQSERAFGEALSAVSRLQRSLNACAYATDAPMQSAICTQLYADSEAAETALSVLPVEMDALEEVSGQISVMGDYACLLSRTAAGGTTVSPKLFSVLTVFSDTVKLLSDQLSEIREAYAQGELRAESRLSLTDSLNNLEEEAGSAGETLNDAFHDLAASLPNSEPLVYDGKYSDHTGEKAFMLSGKAIISPTEARDRAASFLLCDPSALQPLDFKGGEVPCWRFAYPELNASIAVTVRGGEVLQFLSDCLESVEADPDQAESIADQFLAAHGFPQMELVDSVPGGSEITMTYVPKSDDVLFLPDRVVVRICTASGRVTAYDASDYLKHHHARSFFPDTENDWTPPETWSIESQRKVVLLSQGEQERFCIEYRCRTETGDSVCIDVNAETGLQERILIGETRVQNVD